MGAAGSIAPGAVPDDIQALFDLTERQKAKVADIDSAMLDAEMGKMFKGHNKVIDELCSRSKMQLKSLVEKHPNVAKHLEALNSSGNPYAKFILDSSVPKADFDMECIKAAGDYDEELLVAIIGTSGTKELRRLNELYTQQFSFGIADLCATKNKADAGFAKFVQRIFRFDRDESKEVDYDEAERLLEIIHKAGAARLLGVDEDAIIDVLATASRVQCMAINELYQKRHKMKLERALNMKFKGTFSKLLILWTTPLPGAIVNCAGFLMQKIIPDKNAIMRFFARFDKDLLKLADAACREMHQKSLAEHMSSALSGNLLRALKVWIEEASPDKGFQKIIDIYIEGKLDEGYSLEEIYGDAELLAKLQFLLEKLAGELKLFLITHKEKIDPADLAIMTRSQASVQGLAKTVSDIKLKQQSMRNFTDLALSSDGDEDSSSHGHHGKTPKTPKTFHMEFDIPELPEEDAEAESATKEMMAQRKFSIVLPNNIQRNVHEQLINHTYAYLISVFESADDDAEGSLEVDFFWETLGKLPIHLFGFVPRDLELIKKSSAWENDGRVYYYEALLEFADSVVTAIENKEDDDETNGGRDVIKIIDRLTKEKEDQEENEDKLGGNINFSMDRAVYATKSSSRRTLSIRFGNIPVYFRQYVIDTVAAFDMDCSGYLKEADLVKLLETLQVPQDTLNYQYFVDNYPKSTSTKGPVAMFDLKYCAETVFKVINSWFTDGAEHYICLMDKNSGAYFWFNTLDQSTQWVDNSVTGEVSSEFKDFVLDEAVVAAAAANDSADAKMASEAPAKSPRAESKNDVADEKGAPTDENEEKFSETSTKGSARSSREEKEAAVSESSKPSLNRARTSPEDLCDAKNDDAAVSGSRKLATSQSVDAIDMAGDGSAADKDTEPTASGQDDLQEEE